MLLAAGFGWVAVTRFGVGPNPSSIARFERAVLSRSFHGKNSRWRGSCRRNGGTHGRGDGGVAGSNVGKASRLTLPSKAGGRLATL
jgi:hypothetical protein